MVDLTSHGVSFAFLQGQLLAARSAARHSLTVHLAPNFTAANTNGVF
jgi:hypothetical protein